MSWTEKDLQDQSGKRFLVTGANTGLGFETSLMLAEKNAEVIMGGRNKEKLDSAISKIRQKVPEAKLTPAIFDLSSVGNVKNFAGEFKEKYEKLDALINNAGVMIPPPDKTEDGFELQFGVNFIGHFVLTAGLFGLIKKSPGSRVVTMSSLAHKNAGIDFENLRLEKPYDKWREYGQSKMADLMFAFELQRRIDKAGLDVLSVAAHPGISKTHLLRHDDVSMIEKYDYMHPRQGALPELYAATENVAGGGYIGPDGEKEINGYPAEAYVDPYAYDKKVAAKLWNYAERETGVRFGI